jgi:hypothetical protein
LQLGHSLGLPFQNFIELQRAVEAFEVLNKPRPVALRLPVLAHSQKKNRLHRR